MRPLPYMLMHPFESLGDCWYHFRKGIRNLYRWFPLVWRDMDWDWEPMVDMLVFKLRCMERATYDWQTVSAPRNRRNMAIARRCLERVAAEDYGDIEHARFVKHRDPWRTYISAVSFSRMFLCQSRWCDDRGIVSASKLAGAQRKADLQLATKIIERQMMRWWS